MKYLSTRDPERRHAVGFAEAILHGLAPDGGLYVPERFPRFDPGEFDEVEDMPAFAARVLAPFLQGDRLGEELDAICRGAFDFPIPLVDLRPGTALLELYWGPTAAFKDVGARFLAECMSRLPGDRLVMVATSGDTGGAVASAFWRKPGIEVAVLFPEHGVSARQRHQLTCWGDNVRAFAVGGVFDDCQRLVKDSFADRDWVEAQGLTSANSINVGRLLPQAVYHARASIQYLRRHGTAPGLVIPTGNLGNALAALWAREMGFPIARIVFAANANRPVPEFLRSGNFEPMPTVQTLANAMDVGAPSNVERLRHLFPDIDKLRCIARAEPVDDDAIRAVIRSGRERWGRVFCPHTATAVHLREQLGGEHEVIVATAHPAKFETVVEPLVGEPVEVPPALAALFDRPSHCTQLGPDLGELRVAIGR